MSGKPKRTVRTIFAVIFIIIGLVCGGAGGLGFYFRQSVVSQKAEVEKDKTAFVVHVDNRVMSREDYFEYADKEIKEWNELMPVVAGIAGVGVIFILLAVNNISKNKKDKRAEQATA